MAEMIGDLLQGEPSMQEPAGTCVTQAMRAEPIQLHALLSQPHPYHGTDTGTRQWAERRLDGEEQGSVRTAGARLSKIAQDRVTDRYSQRVVLGSPKFGPRNVNLLSRPVHIVQRQPLDFSASQAVVDSDLLT